MEIFTIQNALFALVIFVSNAINTLTGFAGSLLAMPPSIQIQGLETAKVAVNAFALVNVTCLFISNYKKVDKKVAAKIIVIMGAALAVGMWLATVVELGVLLKVYAVFIILVALKEMFYKGNLDFNDVALLCILIGAGLFQGLFVSGGPLLIIYLTKKIDDKDQMRGTLALIWMFLNGYMFISQLLGGQITTHEVTVTAIGLPAVFLGVFVGNKLAKKIDKDKFLKIVYVLLIISALTLW